MRDTTWVTEEQMLSVSTQGGAPTEDGRASPGAPEVAGAYSLWTVTRTKVLWTSKPLPGPCVAINEKKVLKVPLKYWLFFFLL